MFSKSVLVSLLNSHRPFFNDLIALKDDLNSRFYGLSEQIRCLMLAIASGESMLLIGPPGTAKSRLIRSFVETAGLIKGPSQQGAATPAGGGILRKVEREERYFEYLLTPFTEPNELFGYFDIGKLMSNAKAGAPLERMHQGMMQHADVVFLDEVFNASSAILNSLLTFVNERRFHDRGESYAVNLSCLFGATNFPPRKQELVAIYDRFLLRCWVDNVRPEADDVGALLGAGWRETNAGDHKKRLPQLLDGAQKFRRSVRALSEQNALSINPQDASVELIMARLADIIEHARRQHLSQVSNRRLVAYSKIFMINALLRAAEEGRSDPEITVKDDLMVFVRFGLDRKFDPTQMTAFQSLLVGAT